MIPEFCKYDRSHRNLREFLTFQDDVLSPRGQALISASQNIDLNTTGSRAMAAVLMTFAEMEARKASDRMKATIQFCCKKENILARNRLVASRMMIKY